MKKLLLIINLCLLFNGASAQDGAQHIISIYPAGILNKTRVSYEKVITYYKSIGFTFTNYDKFNEYRGAKAELFYRKYEGEGVGFYCEYSVAIGKSYENNYPYNLRTNGRGNASHDILGGVAYRLGLQWFEGTHSARQALVIDVSIGLQIYTDFNAPLDTPWYTIGPGSIINARLAIGYSL